MIKARLTSSDEEECMPSQQDDDVIAYVNIVNEGRGKSCGREDYNRESERGKSRGSQRLQGGLGASG